MRQERNLAKDDMAGLNSFMDGVMVVNDRRKGTLDGLHHEDNPFF
jgi:hypothetical protein